MDRLGLDLDRCFFTAVVFARLLQSDIHGRISTMAVFNYVMRKVWLQQTRIGLSLYDATGQGLLTEMDLENYITELIPTLPQLEGLEKSFHSFYVCTAVRKFLFFLDPLKLGKVRDSLNKCDHDCVHLEQCYQSIIFPVASP